MARPEHSAVSTPFIGRAAELEALTRAWGATGRGEGEVLVVLGHPAMGKTSLLRRTGALAGRRVVRVQGAGAGSMRPLDAAARLGDGLSALLERVDSPGAAVADEGDPVAAAKLLGELLDRVSDDGAAVVLVDDLHDVDSASRVAVNLALRRRVRPHLLVVLAGRPTDPVRSFAEGFEVLELPPLAAADAASLLAASCPGEIAPSVRDHLLLQARGNPLALSTLPSVLSAEQLAGVELLPDPLPVVGDLRDAFTRPLAALGPAARELLELTALASDTSWALLRAAAGEGAAAALEELEHAGLADLDRGKVVAAHPLLCAAAASSTSAANRRALHRRLAGLSGLPEEQRVRHRAAAALGPDEELVEDLVRAAGSMRAHGAPESAALLLDEAVVLTDDGTRRPELRLAAADALALAGQPARAIHRLQQVEQDPLEGPWHVAAVLRRSWIDALSGDPLGSLLRLQECLQHAEDADRSSIHAAMSVPLGMLGLVGEIEAQSSLAVEHGTHGAVAWHVARVVHCHATISLDEPAGRAAARAVVTDVDLPQAIVADPLFALHAGRVLSMSEDYDLAESVLAQIRAVARRDHAQVSLAIAMGALGEVWVRSGRFAAAAGVLDDAVALSLGTGQRAFVPFWFALRARVRSARGDHDGARADLDAGFGIAEELSLPGARYFLLAAAGLDALARGDAVGAIGHLEECRDFEDASDVLSPNVGRWRPDLVEAYCAVGDLDAARAALVPLRAAGGAEGAGRWTVASAARAAALVDGIDDPRSAAAGLREAATRFDPDVDGFDLGRTLLNCAESAWRAGVPPAELRDIITDARHAFRRVAAPAWERRLDACTMPSQPLGGALASLTVAETAVLERLGSGSSNSQIAAALGVSPKTVANHLSSVYRKLGVATRTEAVHRYLTR